eukprot:15073863-Alexandrium_andersonii.AAC.1
MAAMTCVGHAARAASAALPAAPFAEPGGTAGRVLAEASTLAQASRAVPRQVSADSGPGGVRPADAGALRRRTCGPRSVALPMAAQAECAPSMRTWTVRVAC